MWSLSVYGNDLSSPLGTCTPVPGCLARWLCMLHQSWYCEWDPVTLWRIMSSVVNLAVFLWIRPRSETATVPVPCLFLCEFTEAVDCVCTQIFLCFFPFVFVSWRDLILWFGPKDYTWFSLILSGGRERGKMGKILGLFQANSLKSNVLCRKDVPSLKDYMKIHTDLP